VAFIGLHSFVNNAQAQLPTNGLMLYYNCNSTVTDSSGNNNNPIFNNTSFVPDRLGNQNSAIHFNGINNYIQVPNQPSLNSGTTITLSVWVRPTGFYKEVCHANNILTKGPANYLDGSYALRYDDALYTNGGGCDGAPLKDSIHLNFRATGTATKPYKPFVTYGKWHHVLYLNNGDSAKLFVDCQLKYAVKFTETFTNTNDLFFGRSEDDMFTFWLNADLDDIRIYNRALNLKEITALCAEKPLPPTKAKTLPTNILPALPQKPNLAIQPRASKLVKTIDVFNDSITVTLYDNGTIDGDSVTLIVNNIVIKSDIRLTAEGQKFVLKTTLNTEQVVQMYAQNLGSIPPNTALMVVYDGQQRHEVRITSNDQINGTVTFRRKQKL
jgi:hypothetical protein